MLRQIADLDIIVISKVSPPDPSAPSAPYYTLYIFEEKCSLKNTLLNVLPYEQAS